MQERRLFLFLGFLGLGFSFPIQWNSASLSSENGNFWWENLKKGGFVPGGTLNVSFVGNISAVGLYNMFPFPVDFLCYGVLLEESILPLEVSDLFSSCFQNGSVSLSVEVAGKVLYSNSFITNENFLIIGVQGDENGVFSGKFL